MSNQGSHSQPTGASAEKSADVRPAESEVPNSLPPEDANAGRAQPFNYADFYGKWHEDSTEHVESRVAYYESLLGPWLPEPDSKSVLDLGCGSGLALSCLQQMGFRQILGIEIDPGQYEWCRRRGLPVELVADAEVYLNERPATYDVVLLMDVLEHIPVHRQLSLLRAVRASLRPGGRLLLTVPNASSSVGFHMRWADWTHTCCFTKDGLEFVLLSAGFPHVEVHPACGRLRPARWWLLVPLAIHGLLRAFVRSLRRLELIAEFGPRLGCSIPLSVNLLAVARLPSVDGLPDKST